MRKPLIQIYVETLKQCRTQMGFSQDDVKKKGVSKIVEIEKKQKDPTPKQLTTLANLYEVPRWVFLKKKLPTEYRYDKMLAFRRFKKSEAFSLPKVRQLITRIEQYRSLFLELRSEMDNPIPSFTLPTITSSNSAEKTALSVRKWLKLKKPLKFDLLRERLEDKNIFIFMTSKYTDWSNVDKDSFRGISIYYDTLPIIVINDSDSKKAQSFTLFHELGHLLKKNTAIGCEFGGRQEERWCDELAGCVLMPSTSDVFNQSFDDLKVIKTAAKELEVSAYSCLVRLKQLGIIDQIKYKHFENELQKEYVALQKRLRQNQGGPSRDRTQEIQKQFGNPFVRSVFNALHNKELTLHKTSQILGLKKASQVLKLEKNI